MSKKETDNPGKSSGQDQVPDLSALDFGPAWAREKGGAKRKPSQGKRGGRDGAKTSGGPRPQRSHRKQDQRQRDEGKFKRGKHDPKRDRKPSVAPAEGVAARIMPIEEGMDAMAKEISATGRTHSVFDLAWLVLGALDRFHVIFESEEELLYKCQKDHSVWLSKQDCLRHFWSTGLIKEYYDEEVTEGEAPAGNFQSVARCGISGKLIGPPNHHSYQQTLLDLHKERFSNMALDRYKSKIVMEHGEEAVAEWVEQEKQQSSWRPKPEEKGVPTEKPEDQVDGEAAGDATEKVEEGEQETVVANEPGDVLPVFKSRREVEDHFLGHGFEQVYSGGNKVSTLANIPAKMISPGLLATMRHVIGEEKRYPGKLASFLCRQMSGRHLAVFKWKKRLHCGPARPKYVPDDMVMADRPSKLFHWVLDHPSGQIDKMWQDCLPADVDEDTRHAWYHDLHWLINEGLVLLFSDGKLHAAKELKKPTEPKEQKLAQPKAGEDAVAEDEAAANTGPSGSPAGQDAEKTTE